ncbi:MAG: alpha/beta hydrolase [Sulfurospirillum sp.]
MALKEIGYKSTRYNISYEIHNKNRSDTLIFLHGWGSNKEIMRDSFAKYLGDFRLLFIDLPGFGNSSIHTALETKEYADIIDIFLKTLQVEKRIIFGHSFGGKVAALLNPDILVLLGTAGILNKKSLKTRLKIKIFKLLHPLFGKNLYKFFATKDVDGLSRIMYETLKKVVDEDFSGIFANFENRAFVYWGEDDKAVPLSNAYKIDTLIADSRLRIYDGGHFFFLDNAKQICQNFREDLKQR